MRILIILLLYIVSLNMVFSQNLNSYIDIALENNPDVQAFELKYERVKEKANEANTLPNTQFGVGYFVREPETRTGAQKFKLSASQMFPWFGTITARKNYTDALANVEYEDIAIVQRKLAMSVTQSYYNLYAIKATQNVLKENIQLLKTQEKLALAAVKVSKASAVDILQLQIRQNELDEKIQVLQQEFLAEQTTFNQLLNRENNIPIDVPSYLDFPFDSNFLNTDLTLHPELVKYDKLFESIEQSELLNKKEKKPQIGLGLDYIYVAKRPDLSFSDNGKDILMPMLSVSVPIFNKKYKSITSQNELKQQELKAQQQSRLNALKTILDKAIKMQEAAKISYTTLNKNLQQTKEAETILIKTYETGIVDFDKVLDIQALQLKFETKQIEAIKNYYLQQAIINYLTN